MRRFPRCGVVPIALHLLLLMTPPLVQAAMPPSIGLSQGNSPVSVSMGAQVDDTVATLMINDPDTTTGATASITVGNDDATWKLANYQQNAAELTVELQVAMQTSQLQTPNHIWTLTIEAEDQDGNTAQLQLTVTVSNSGTSTTAGSSPPSPCNPACGADKTCQNGMCMPSASAGANSGSTTAGSNAHNPGAGSQAGVCNPACETGYTCFNGQCCWEITASSHAWATIASSTDESSAPPEKRDDTVAGTGAST